MNTQPTPVSRIGLLLSLSLLSVLAPLAQAQAPVEDGRLRENAIQQGQQKAGIAYREMQQAEQARKQAEQESQRANVEFNAAQKRADELKLRADTASKNFEAAKVKEAQARKSYDAAVNAVDQTWQKPAQK